VSGARKLSQRTKLKRDESESAERDGLVSARETPWARDRHSSSRRETRESSHTGSEAPGPPALPQTHAHNKRRESTSSPKSPLQTTRGAGPKRPTAPHPHPSQHQPQPEPPYPPHPPHPPPHQRVKARAGKGRRGATMASELQPAGLGDNASARPNDRPHATPAT